MLISFQNITNHFPLHTESIGRTGNCALAGQETMPVLSLMPADLLMPPTLFEIALGKMCLLISYFGYVDAKALPCRHFIFCGASQPYNTLNLCGVKPRQHR
jgi:hypothetical protein